MKQAINPRFSMVSLLLFFISVQAHGTTLFADNFNDGNANGWVVVKDSDAAPTWVVEYNPVNSWSIDSDGRLRDLLSREYVEVATVCERPVYLRRDVDRERPPDLGCDQPWR